MDTVVRRTARHAFVGRILRGVGYSPNRPVFVVGTGRCGSSLLSTILESHNRLVVFPDEANELWHPHSYPFRNASIETPSMIEDPNAFTGISVSNWPPGHDELIRAVFSSYNLVHGPTRTLVVKSAMLSFMIPKIQILFPDARFLHIYRSGPPVVESWLVKDWSKHSDRFRSKDDFRVACARYWNNCILEIDRRNTGSGLAERGLLLEVSYESLCRRPEAILSRIAAFLGVDRSGFLFDIRGIQSQDYKVGDYSADPTWRLPLKMMAEGMELKGFPGSGKAAPT